MTQILDRQVPANAALKVVHRVSTGLVVAVMASGGLMDALRDESALAVFAELGYPAYFAVILGVAKLLGSIALVAPVPRTVREWAYAGFTIDVTCAIASLLAIGKPAGALVIPYVALAVLLVSYATWRLRNVPVSVGSRLALSPA